MISPSNKVIVKVKHKYVSNISDLLKRASIQNNSSVDPTDVVNIVGEVVSVPKTVYDKFGLTGFSCEGIEVGDMAIFSHQVIYSFNEKTEGGEPMYKNRIWYNGQEYFLADISLIYAVIRNDEIKMINGYVMLRPFQESKIVLFAGSKIAKGTVKCQIMYIGGSLKNEVPIDAKQGDWAYFNPMIATKYQINNKPFVIVTQTHILGVDSAV